MKSNRDIAPLFAGRHLWPHIDRGSEFISCTTVNFCSQIFMGANIGVAIALYRGLTADAARRVAGTVVDAKVTFSNDVVCFSSG